MTYDPVGKTNREEEFLHLPLFVEIRSLIEESITQCEYVCNEPHRPAEQTCARPRRCQRDVVDSPMEQIKAGVENDTERKQA